MKLKQVALTKKEEMRIAGGQKEINQDKKKLHKNKQTNKKTQKTEKETCQFKLCIANSKEQAGYLKKIKVIKNVCHRVAFNFFPNFARFSACLQIHCIPCTATWRLTRWAT